MVESEHFLSAVHRLGRAQKHIETLQCEAEKWIKSGVYELSLETDAKDQPFLQVTRLEVPPAEFGALIGDILHNLRSSLDHMAFGLVVANYGRRRVPDEYEGTSAFPIFNSGPKFRRKVTKGAKKGLPAHGSGLYKIRGIDPLAQAEIERLQPYHRRKLPEARVLWALEWLSNHDKHRTPPLTVVALTGSRTASRLEGAQFRGHGIAYTGRLKLHTVVARWNVQHIAAESKMQVDTDFKIAIAFGKGPAAGQAVTDVLPRIWNFINNVVRPRLGHFLP
jgi:hypothetical protein